MDQFGEELATPEKLNAITTIWGKIYKKELIKNIKFVSRDEVGLCEDGIFNIEAFQRAQRVIFEKYYLYHYRKVVAGNSLTQKKEDYFYEREKTFYNYLNKMIQNEKLGNQYYRALDNRMTVSLIEIGMRFMNENQGCYGKIKMILNSEEYKKSCKNFDISNMPFHWKVFFWNAKHRVTVMVYLLLKMICILASKK